MTTAPITADQTCAVVREYIAAIFERDDLVEIRFVPHKRAGAPSRKNPAWVSAAELEKPEYITRLQSLNEAGYHIFVSPNPRKTAGVPGVRAKDCTPDRPCGKCRKCVVIARNLFVDFDNDTTPFEATVRIAEAGLPEATALINTGYGVHAYWRLDEPLHDLDEWELYQTGLIDLLDSDTAIKDPPRVMRLPGFLNVKKPDPVACTCAGCDPRRQYSISEFPRAAPRPMRTTNPNGQVSQDERANALRYLGRLKAERADPRESWLAVGMCLHSVDQTDSMLGEWDQWSRQSDKWEDGACCEEWDSFHADGALTIASLNKWSTEDSPLATAKIGGGVDVPAPALTFDIERTPGRARAKITALVDDNPIVVESLDIADSGKRDAFAQMIHGRAPQFDLDMIQDKLLQAAAARPPAPPSDDEDQVSRDELLQRRDEQTERALAAMPHEVVTDAEAMLADDQLIERILTDIEVLGVVGERELAATIYCIGTSRLLVKPLSSCTQGPSASGKSFINRQIARLFPPETKLLATAISPQALFYFQPGRLIHTFIIGGERARVETDEQAEANKAWRELVADGALDKVVTITRGGCPETRSVHQDGPVSFVETTTRTRIFDEDQTRLLMLHTDESPEQTRRIKRAIAQAAQAGPVDPARIIARHHALQRLLKRVEVRIPFAEALDSSLPSDRIEARRAAKDVMEMIATIALLHQRQRVTGRVEHGEIISATIRDYAIARRLLMGPISRALGGVLAPGVSKLFERLNGRYGTESFTSSEAARDDLTIRSRPKMGEHLRTISDATGALELVEVGQGSKPNVWRIVGPIPDQGELWLPTADQLEDEL